MASAPPRQPDSASTQEQIKRDLLQRLLTKISQATQRLPLDVDYLKFVVNQEMVLFRALSGQVEMPQEVVNALTEQSILVNADDSSNMSRCQVPVMQAEMGQPKYVVSPQQLQSLVEMSLPVYHVLRNIWVYL
ncbi:hypothetical protein PFLUV_G00028590 [Perca fluviatilis]|uniref:Uncharacterized protein n=1 Tax=Perca fluviatilis TaxID=8168 RepID=A0A6A5FHP1_PERFL|nr:hypothetical protein PFLUV_G00028590 [Perca fluviatilis]